MARAKGTGATKGKKKTLTDELATLLEKIFLPDLKERAQQPKVAASLRTRYDAEKALSRTAADFADWVEHTVEQVGAAWILSCVFVRTLEDRDLVDRRRLGGEGALDSQQQFFEIAPSLTERDYVLTTFRELASFPGIAEVLGSAHNPAWRLSPSNDSVRALLALLREPGEGGLRFGFGDSDTRLLGDLYQDLSEGVRKRYALLQTPDFVERFILDQTLEPAIQEFGLEQVRVIDPTCGSGHFLLGAFHRLFEHRLRAQPGLDRREHAARSMAQVYGVNLNPYAVAIARFRLTLAYLEHAGISTLSQAPRIDAHLIAADSLLHGGHQRRLAETADENVKAAWGDQMFVLDDADGARRVFGQRYHAVVGNPPYITCKDSALRQLYRERYESAAGKYALGAPFTERFFELAESGGFVGLINSNAWTKRDYGKTLIESVLPRIDLEKVVDTSGCYLPGHGTPTLLLFGRNRPPVSDRLLAVLGKRGERVEPQNPATAPVSSEITAHHDEPGFDGTHISVEHIDRVDLARHPWVLAGGGARPLLKRLEALGHPLESYVDSIGIVAFTLEDDAYIHPGHCHERWHVETGSSRPILEGDRIRDWHCDEVNHVLFPYDNKYQPIEDNDQSVLRALWPYKAMLSASKLFDGKSKVASGYKWHEFGRLTAHKLANAAPITFSLVTTHFRAIRGRPGWLFKHSAPVIKLREEFTEADYQSFLGYANSSTTAFWCRLCMFPKGGDEVGEGGRLSKTPWRDRLEFAGNLLQQLPVPSFEGGLQTELLELVVAAERTARQLEGLAPYAVLSAALAGSANSLDLQAACSGMKVERSRLRGILVSLQEEIDWRTYGLFGLPTAVASSLAEVEVPVEPNQRPCEVRLARDIASDISASEWFRVHSRPPLDQVGGPLEALYASRLRLLDDPTSGPVLQMLETPETKRRWSPLDDEADFSTAAQTWLLRRIESTLKTQSAGIASIRDVVSLLGSDSHVAAVHGFLTRTTGQGLVESLTELTDAGGVPFLASLRHTEKGMRKRESWERSWELQRSEDVGRLEHDHQHGEPTVPSPRRYVREDFQRNYWSLRGELDVPKERFIQYPGCERDEDKSPLVGWAGWNHLERAQALASLFRERKEQDGWASYRLAPILAGLLELVPWLKQWHNEPDSDGQCMGDAYEAFVLEKTRELGFTLDDLRAWRATKPQRGRPASAAKSDSTSGEPPKPRTRRAKAPSADHESGAPPKGRRGRPPKAAAASESE